MRTGRRASAVPEWRHTPTTAQSLGGPHPLSRQDTEGGGITTKAGVPAVGIAIVSAPAARTRLPQLHGVMPPDCIRG